MPDGRLQHVNGADHVDRQQLLRSRPSGPGHRGQVDDSVAALTGLAQAILEQLDCTTVVEPGDKVRQDKLGNLLISVASP